MKLVYNGYEHQDNEVSFAITIRMSQDDFMRTRVATVRYVITGVVIGTSFADLTDKLDSLEDAYSVPGGDLTFYDNNGAETAHKLRSSDCLGGTRIVGFEYLDGYPGTWGSSTEYVNKRTYRIAVEGDQVIRGGLLAFSETYTYFGDGGPEDKWVESLLGAPQKQTLKQQTTGIGIQQGTAIGESGYPPIPDMLYPDLLMRIKGQSPMIKPETPKTLWTGETHVYKVSWRFIFEGATALPGVPNVRY